MIGLGQCFVVGGVPTSAIEDKTLLLLLQAVTRDGVAAKCGGADVKAQSVLSETVQHCNVTDQQDGRYGIELMAGTVGLCGVTISVDGQAIDGCPFGIIVAAALDTASCDCFGSGITMATEDEQQHFTVAAKDKRSNPLRVDPPSVVIESQAGPIDACVQPMEGDGLFSVSYVPTLAGELIVHVSFDGIAIAQSPIVVTVAPLSSIFESVGLDTAVVERQATQFYVGAKRQYHPPLLPPINVQLTSATATFDADVSHQPDGRYRVSYVAPAAGVVHIHVTVKGVPIDGSPFAVNVLELAAFVTAEGDGLHAAIEDEVSRFEIQVARRYNVDDLCAITVELSGISAIASVSRLSASVFACEYTAQSAGGFQLSVAVYGRPIGASPFEIHSQAAARLFRTDTLQPAIESEQNTFFVEDMRTSHAGQGETTSILAIINEFVC